MDAEILETKLFIKKRQISIMMDDIKAIEKAATVMRSIGYSDRELKKASQDIRQDVVDESKEAVRLHTAYTEAKKTAKKLLQKEE